MEGFLIYVGLIVVAWQLSEVVKAIRGATAARLKEKDHDRGE